MRCSRLTLCSLLLSGCLSLCLFFFLHDTAQAGWPVGGRDYSEWYVCTSVRIDEATEPWSEPDCTEITWFNSLVSDVISGISNCSGVNCNVWGRFYIVPASGVLDMNLSCEFADIGTGSTPINTFAWTETDSHTTRAGPGTITGDHSTTYTPVYTGTHISGADLWTNSAHDPVARWGLNPLLSNEIGFTLFSGTNNASAGAEGRFDCVIVSWQGEWEVNPTPTPAPTPTIVDPTATPSPTLTPVATNTPSGFPDLVLWPTLTPGPTPTPVPEWDIDVVYTPTVDDPSCYVFIPALPMTTTQWLELFNLPVPDYDDIGVCIEPFEMEFVVGEWDVGRLALLLVSVGLVVGVWRMFDA